MHALPSRIADRRRARGWSLRTLAAESGVSPAMLSAIENGSRTPTVRLAYRIARALGCSISELVDEDGRPRVADAASRAGSVLEAEGVRRVGFSEALPGRPLELVAYELEPRAEVGPLEPNAPGTLETVAALEGDLELVLDDDVLRIRPGSCRTHGTARTSYRNPSRDAPCRFVVLLEAP